MLWKSRKNKGGWGFILCKTCLKLILLYVVLFLLDRVLRFVPFDTIYIAGVRIFKHSLTIMYLNILPWWIFQKQVIDRNRIITHFFWKIITVCNFQSMKSPVELNSLLSKFFCLITWLLYQLIRHDTGRLENDAFTSNPVVSSKQ